MIGEMLEETIKISKELHTKLRAEKKVSKVPMKYLLEQAWELYEKAKEDIKK